MSGGAFYRRVLDSVDDSLFVTWQVLGRSIPAVIHDIFQPVTKHVCSEWIQISCNIAKARYFSTVFKTVSIDIDSSACFPGGQNHQDSVDD